MTFQFYVSVNYGSDIKLASNITIGTVPLWDAYAAQPRMTAPQPAIMQQPTAPQPAIIQQPTAPPVDQGLPSGGSDIREDPTLLIWGALSSA